MAQRLMPSTQRGPKTKRPRGRPRKDGRPAGSGPVPRPPMGSNVSDQTRLEFLERGRMALVQALTKKQEYQSAWRVYSQLVKDAKKIGATEIHWTLEAMRADPLDVQRQMVERVRMAKLANIPIGVQLSLFDEIPTPGTPLEQAIAKVGKTAAQAAQEAWAREDSARQGDANSPQVSPPKPGPDDDEPDEDEEEDEDRPPEEEDEEEGQAAGYERLEQSPEDAQAYVMGQRMQQLGRTLDANPYGPNVTMHNAWIRGWQSKAMGAAQ